MRPCPYQIKSKTDLEACLEGFHKIDFLQGLNTDDFFSAGNVFLTDKVKLDFSKLFPNDLT